MNPMIQKGNWHRPSKADEIQPRPWLHVKAIEYFAGLLRPDMDVIEFGGGGSTLWLADKVRRVVTYEPNKEWFDKLTSIRPYNVTLKNADSSIFEYQNHVYDLLFIDGEPVERRGEWLSMAHLLVKPGGIVVLDNANRPEYLNEWREFQSRAVLLFQNVDNGGKHFVTEFYKLK